jgi:hypothetical protein
MLRAKSLPAETTLLILQPVARPPPCSGDDAQTSHPIRSCSQSITSPS